MEKLIAAILTGILLLAFIAIGAALDGLLFMLVSPVPITFVFAVRCALTLMLAASVVKGIWSLDFKKKS